MKNSPATLADRNRKRAHWKATIDPTTVPETVHKVCRDCRELQPCGWNHTFSQVGRPEYRTRCSACFLKNLSAHRKKTRTQLSKTIQRRRVQLKLRCIDLLGGACLKCGYKKSYRGLTFHHRDPVTKVDDVCRMIANRSWSSVLEEIQKCDLLCFNCHMELSPDDVESQNVFQVSSSEGLG